MFPKEKRDALEKTLQDTIGKNVPGVLEGSTRGGTLACGFSENDRMEVFCLRLIEHDHLELRLPECPEVAAFDGRFEKTEGPEVGRLLIFNRTDLPGEILNVAIKEAFGIAEPGAFLGALDSGVQQQGCLRRSLNMTLRPSSFAATISVAFETGAGGLS